MKDVKMVTTKLLGGAEVEFDENSQTKCKSCGARIIFAVTAKSKKYIPIEIVREGVYQTHFATCRNADSHRGSAMNRVREMDNNQDYLNNM